MSHQGIKRALSEDILAREAVEAVFDAFQRGWIYEEDLPPELPPEKYNQWFEKSKIVCGVRMGPKFE
jgi:hypothetical protein